MRDAASKYNVDHGGHHTTISTTFVDPVSACHALLAVCHGGFMILTPSPCPSTRHSARVVLQAPLSCGSRAQAEVQSVPTQPGIAQISNWPMQFFRWRSWPAGISTELPRTHHVFIGEPSACLTHPPAFNDTENKALSMTLTRASIFCSRLLRTQPAQLLTTASRGLSSQPTACSKNSLSEPWEDMSVEAAIRSVAEEAQTGGSPLQGDRI